MDKNEALNRLAQQRKMEKMDDWALGNWKPRNVHEYDNGIFDRRTPQDTRDHVSPYSKGAGNEDSNVLLLLQDWSSHSSMMNFSKKGRQDSIEIGRSRNLKTNTRLAALLQNFLGLTIEQTYATNLFPFIKPGGMSARIPPKILIKAAKKYAIPQIEIVQPKVVICLGLETFNAVCSAQKRATYARLASAVPNGFDDKKLGAHIWCLPHPASRMAHDKMDAYWLAMARSTPGLKCPPQSLSDEEYFSSVLLVLESLILSARTTSRQAEKQASTTKQYRDELRNLLDLVESLAGASGNREDVHEWLKTDMIRVIENDARHSQGIAELRLLKHRLEL